MAKVTIDLDENMLYNLRVMGGYASNDDALKSAEKDIGNILRDGRLGIPVIGGRLQIGVFASEAKNAWIEFQRESGVCVDLALVDTEFKNDDLSILTYGDPYSEDYTECTVITKNDVLASIGEIESE